ncbi:MAG: KpsF/GutQ family sugar-phosphate isomerase [Kiritimatiellae bacterium]|nr:KpsF/GutQ family sugar-phosphate isomerase [Kiritimatiellia bacterium]
MTETEMTNRAREVFDIEIEGLKRTRDSIGSSFTDAVKMILDCSRDGGIVVVSGVGKNLHIAEKMSAIFASTGVRSIVLNPVQAMHGDLGMVSAKDILVALSFSGESDEVLKLIPAIRRHGLKIVSMTGNSSSSLAEMSDIHLEIPCGREACPFGMAPTNSTTATMAMGDALAMVLIDAQKFPIEDYAMNHPAGAIGRALVMKAADIMRKGDRLALVSPKTTVMDTLMAMTRAKSGSAVIAGEDGMLAGIFTDGDFRRLVSDASEKAASLLEAEVSSVMTPSPMFVKESAYASELLKVFEKKRIDDLPVCDDAGRVVGLIDIQDLPKMKVL